MTSQPSCGARSTIMEAVDMFATVADPVAVLKPTAIKKGMNKPMFASFKTFPMIVPVSASLQHSTCAKNHSE